jgi:hypothetical protein
MRYIYLISFLFFISCSVNKKNHFDYVYKSDNSIFLISNNKYYLYGEANIYDKFESYGYFEKMDTELQITSLISKPVIEILEVSEIRDTLGSKRLFVDFYDKNNVLIEYCRGCSYLVNDVFFHPIDNNNFSFLRDSSFSLKFGSSLHNFESDSYLYIPRDSLVCGLKIKINIDYNDYRNYVCTKDRYIYLEKDIAKLLGKDSLYFLDKTFYLDSSASKQLNKNNISTEAYEFIR